MRWPERDICGSDSETSAVERTGPAPSLSAVGRLPTDWPAGPDLTGACRSRTAVFEPANARAVVVLAVTRTDDLKRAWKVTESGGALGEEPSGSLLTRCVLSVDIVKMNRDGCRIRGNSSTGVVGVVRARCVTTLVVGFKQVADILIPNRSSKPS